jgi:hypothetical protein
MKQLRLMGNGAGAEAAAAAAAAAAWLARVADELQGCGGGAR